MCNTLFAVYETNADILTLTLRNNSSCIFRWYFTTNVGHIFHNIFTQLLYHGVHVKSPILSGQERKCSMCYRKEELTKLFRIHSLVFIYQQSSYRSQPAAFNCIARIFAFVAHHLYITLDLQLTFQCRLALGTHSCS